MTQAPLAGLQVVESASFVAGPSGCMSLAQLGADVIRLDPVGGGSDFRRWPVSRRTGESLYWTALNKGKRSVALDLRRPEGRQLLVALATAPGPEAGFLVDNGVGRPWLAHERLVVNRPDMIHIAPDHRLPGRNRGVIAVRVNGRGTAWIQENLAAAAVRDDDADRTLRHWRPIAFLRPATEASAHCSTMTR